MSGPPRNIHENVNAVILVGLDMHAIYEVFQPNETGLGNGTVAKGFACIAQSKKNVYLLVVEEDNKFLRDNDTCRLTIRCRNLVCSLDLSLVIKTCLNPCRTLQKIHISNVVSSGLRARSESVEKLKRPQKVIVN